MKIKPITHSVQIINEQTYTSIDTDLFPFTLRTLFSVNKVRVNFTQYPISTISSRRTETSHPSISLQPDRIFSHIQTYKLQQKLY